MAGKWEKPLSKANPEPIAGFDWRSDEQVGRLVWAGLACEPCTVSAASSQASRRMGCESNGKRIGLS
jgi:hypothetical protein